MAVIGFSFVLTLSDRLKATSCLACSASKKTCQWEGEGSAPRRRVGRKAEPEAVATGSEDEGGEKAPKKTVRRKSEGAELAEAVREVGSEIARGLKGIQTEVCELRRQVTIQGVRLNEVLMEIYWGEHEETELDNWHTEESEAEAELAELAEEVVEIGED